MPYYRKTYLWKKFAFNIFKGLFLLGTGTALVAMLGDGTEFPVGSGYEMVAAAETQGPLPVFGPKDVSVFFIEPTEGVLTSAFGSRWGRVHNGIDIGGEDGTEILAADSGRVVYAGWLDGYGNCVTIDHENGFETAYAHCSELVISEGEYVAQGQKIAHMGSTGNSTGPHLHFEVKKDGEYLDPLNYVLY